MHPIPFYHAYLEKILSRTCGISTLSLVKVQLHLLPSAGSDHASRPSHRQIVTTHLRPPINLLTSVYPYVVRLHTHALATPLN